MRCIVLRYDVLPLDALGCYGGARVPTPAFDRLAASSVVFDNCFAEEIREPLTDFAADESDGANWLATFTESLGEQLTVVELDDRGGPVSLSEVVRYLNEDGARLLVLNLRGLRSDVSPAERPASAAISEVLPSSSAKQAIIDLDAELASLLAAIGKSPQNDTLLIVTAARGALLAKHPPVEQGCPPLVDAITHMSLLMRITGAPADPFRYGGLVASSDIPATIADWFGDSGRVTSGRSLRPVLHGEAAPARDHVSLRSGAARGIRTASSAAYWWEEPSGTAPTPHEGEPRIWLFLKPEDVHDMLDVSAQNPDLAERMRASNP